jgi:hypothetical protein
VGCDTPTHDAPFAVGEVGFRREVIIDGGDPGQGIVSTAEGLSRTER